MTQTQEKESQIDLRDFTNEELLVIFYKFENIVSSLDKDLDMKRIGKKIDTPMGPGIAYKVIDDAKVEKLKNSKPYKISKTIVSKLKPLVELIVDCDSEMKELSNKLK